MLPLCLKCSLIAPVSLRPASYIPSHFWLVSSHTSEPAPLTVSPVTVSFELLVSFISAMNIGNINVIEPCFLWERGASVGVGIFNLQGLWHAQEHFWNTEGKASFVCKKPSNIDTSWLKQSVFCVAVVPPYFPNHVDCALQEIKGRHLFLAVGFSVTRFL